MLRYTTSLTVVNKQTSTRVVATRIPGFQYEDGQREGRKKRRDGRNIGRNRVLTEGKGETRDSINFVGSGFRCNGDRHGKLIVRGM